jgi:hypothetical protein
MDMPQTAPVLVTAPGLYLQFSNGEAVALTPDLIETRAQAVLSDAGKIPLHVKQAEVFQLCSICPQRGSGDTCHAIRPILALWEQFDQHPSHEPVTAVYRSASGGLVVSADTTMQRALQYVSTLSLLYYCEVGKKYWRYFYGVHPLMSTDDVVSRVYLNMFWGCQGDLDRTRRLIALFHDEVTTTTRCQMERIRLFCHSDSFLNALTLTQLASEFLSMNVEEMIQRQFTTFEQSFFW